MLASWILGDRPVSVLAGFRAAAVSCLIFIYFLFLYIFYLFLSVDSHLCFMSLCLSLSLLPSLLIVLLFIRKNSTRRSSGGSVYLDTVVAAIGESDSHRACGLSIANTDYVMAPARDV